MDALPWLVIVLLLGAAVVGAVRWRQRRDTAPGSASVVRANTSLWLCGMLFGIAVALPPSFLLAWSGGWPGWSAALLLGILAIPIHVAVDLNFPLWRYLSPLGPWIAVAIAAGLYHGTLAVWLGHLYRRQPKRAFAIGAVILALHLGMYLVWQAFNVARKP